METDGSGYGRKQARIDTSPHGWPVRKVAEDHWPVNRNSDRRPVVQLRLQEVLGALRQGDLADSVALVREGREIQFLESQQIVRTLIQVIVETPDHRTIIEQFLGELFRDFKKGQIFEHTELVISVLYALKRSGSALYSSVLDAFANSKIAEVGRIRRFAQMLLNQ